MKVIACLLDRVALAGDNRRQTRAAVLSPPSRRGGQPGGSDNIYLDKLSKNKCSAHATLLLGGDAFRCIVALQSRGARASINAAQRPSVRIVLPMELSAPGTRSRERASCSEWHFDLPNVVGTKSRFLRLATVLTPLFRCRQARRAHPPLRLENGYQMLESPLSSSPVPPKSATSPLMPWPTHVTFLVPRLAVHPHSRLLLRLSMAARQPWAPQSS